MNGATGIAELEAFTALDAPATAPTGAAAPPTAMPTPPRSLPDDGAPGSLVEQLVRDPLAFIARIEHDESASLVRALLITVVLGAGVFGGLVGTYRGGLQVLYCAVKLPLVLIGTLVLCAPAFVAIARATRVAIAARSVIALTLGASARFALVLAGLAPVVWLVHGWFGYHGVVLTIVGTCTIAGIAAAALLFSGLARATGPGLLAGVAFVVVYAVVGAHTAWLLRPFVVRPQTADVPFVRGIEGDLMDAVHTTARSAAGDYAGSEQRRRSFEHRHTIETPAAVEPAAVQNSTNCESPPCD